MGFVINYTIESPNFWGVVPQDNPVKALCLHGTAGSLEASIGRLTNPNSEASSNYIISKTGLIYCLVNPYANKRAWANGIVQSPNLSIPWLAEIIRQGVNPNLVTISIEHEAGSADMYAANFASMPDIQKQASLWLCDKLMTDFRIPRDGFTVIGHHDIDNVDRHYCPGVVDLADWNRRLKTMVTPAPDLNNPNNGTGRWIPTATGVEVNNQYQFLTYWLTNGGLAEFGFPVSPGHWQPSSNNNIWVQYFERARLEYHSDDGRIYRGRVGAELWAIVGNK